MYKLWSPAWFTKETSKLSTMKNNFHDFILIFCLVHLKCWEYIRLGWYWMLLWSEIWAAALSLSFCATILSSETRKNTNNKGNDDFKRAARRERLKWSKQRLPQILRSSSQKKKYGCVDETHCFVWLSIERCRELSSSSKLCVVSKFFLHFDGFYRSEVEANLLIIRTHNRFHSLFDTIFRWAK